MAKVIIIQEIMSDTKESLLSTGLSRVFKQDGYSSLSLESGDGAIDSIEIDSEKLSPDDEIIVIEGDVELAKRLKAPIVLVGDGDKEGVIPRLLGSYVLLEADEREFVKGFLINKLKAKSAISDIDAKRLQERTKIPLLGMLPHLGSEPEPVEESENENVEKKQDSTVDIGVIRLPRISNFSYFNLFNSIEDVSIRFINDESEIGEPDILIIPGSKNTMADLKWIKEKGLDGIIVELSEKIPVFGICEGFHILGKSIDDPDKTQDGGTIKGMGLLPIHTILKTNKERKSVSGTIEEISGVFKSLCGLEYEGHELSSSYSFDDNGKKCLGAFMNVGNVYGSNIHGIFDKKEIVFEIADTIARGKGKKLDASMMKEAAVKNEEEFDKVADVIRESIDMEKVYGIL